MDRMDARHRIAVDFPDIVANLSTVGFVVVDRSFNIILWNRFMELNSHARAEDVLGKNLLDAFPELNRNWLEKKIRSCMILKMSSFSSWRQRPYVFRFAGTIARSRESEFMYQDASIFPVHDHKGDVRGSCISIHDASELAEATMLLDQTMEQALALEESNRRDDLTGLFNRKFFDEQITQEVNSARRYNWPLTLAVIDIDHFKTVNDTYGHAGGDAVLRALAGRLQSMMRASDSLCRYGGEEFALILPRVDIAIGRVLLERLRAAVEAMAVDVGEGVTVSLTLSIGIASLDKGITPGRLMAQADAAMYQSKHAGRNRITCHAAPPADAD